MIRGARLYLHRMQVLEVLCVPAITQGMFSERLSGAGRWTNLFPLLQVGDDLEGLGNLPRFVAAHDLAYRPIHLHHLGRHALRYLLPVILTTAEHTHISGSLSQALLCAHCLGRTRRPLDAADSCLAAGQGRIHALCAIGLAHAMPFGPECKYDTAGISSSG